MMIKKLIVVSMVFIFSYPNLFAETPEVSIQKAQGRTEAVVKPEGKKVAKEEKGVLDRMITKTENAIMDTVATGSKSLGKGLDLFVGGVQTVGGLVLSPVFKTLDVVKWHERKEEKT